MNLSIRSHPHFQKHIKIAPDLVLVHLPVFDNTATVGHSVVMFYGIGVMAFQRGRLSIAFEQPASYRLRLALGGPQAAILGLQVLNDGIVALKAG